MENEMGVLRKNIQDLIRLSTQLQSMNMMKQRKMVIDTKHITYDDSFSKEMVDRRKDAFNSTLAKFGMKKDSDIDSAILVKKAEINSKLDEMRLT